MRIVAIGEIIFDIFNGEAKIGGAPLNFCAHCARLGAESVLVSAVGNDALGDCALEKLGSFGVDTACVQRNAFPTGQCIVTVTNGNPQYDVVSPAAYDKIRYTDEAFTADIFAFGTLIQRDEMSQSTLHGVLKNGRFKEIFCDINLRKNCYNKASCLTCLENATILKISEEEEPLLNEFGFYIRSSDEKETVRAICDAFENIRLVLFTKGENGSLVFDKIHNEFYEIPADKADVVSTVGAGDSYSAAFLCEYLRSGNIEQAAKDGSRLAAYVVSHRQAVPD